MNKITQAQIDTLLIEANYQIAHRVFGKQCIVIAQLRNGFTIIGESACVDPNNYDEEIGHSLAMKRISDKLWELEGYSLQKVLAGEL